MRIILLTIIGALLISCMSPYDPAANPSYIVIAGTLSSDKYFYDPSWGHYIEIHHEKIDATDAVELYTSGNGGETYLKIDSVCVQDPDKTIHQKGIIVVSDKKVSMLDYGQSLLGQKYRLYVFKHDNATVYPAHKE